MKQFDIRITVEPTVRVIAEMVNIFSKLDSSIYISKNMTDRIINAKSFVGLLSLAPRYMDTLHIFVNGTYENNDITDIKQGLKYIFLNV